MYLVYILRSTRQRRFYIGHTSDINKRLQTHNNGEVRSTKAYRPWAIVYTEPHENKQDAYGRELKVKSYKGGEAFKRLIQE
jgi:putative endonuclease